MEIKEDVSINNKIFHVTYKSNTPSNQAIENLAKEIIKIIK